MTNFCNGFTRGETLIREGTLLYVTVKSLLPGHRPCHSIEITELSLPTLISSTAWPMEVYWRSVHCVL